MDRGFDHAQGMAGSDVDPEDVFEDGAEQIMAEPKVLLIVGGGIAAYKACEVVRLIRKGGGSVNCVVTDGGQQFVTPMALAALSENPVYTSLWDLKNESEMGHIQLSREADLVVVCPATADILAKMAAGIADDLATTLILATDKPVMVAPAMNVRMWEHEATQRNVEWLRQAGVTVLEPDEGEMACGEFGPGRLPDPEAIWAAIAQHSGIEYSAPEKVAEPAPLKAVAKAADESLDVLRAIRDAEPEGDIFEPLEPEEEEPKSGLGSLLSAIIPRSTKQRSQKQIEEREAAALAEAEAAAAEQEEVAEVVEEIVEAEPEGDVPEPGFSSLLASKGGAKSAPPTDPEAINHEVIEGKQAPEPVEGEGAGAFIEGGKPVDIESLTPQELIEDPLAGQPAFDENPEHRPLYGKHVLVTAGPTHEPIDPVRYLANRSSGKQGFALAAMAAAAGARVTLVAGPVHLSTPPGVDRIDVESAQQMADAVKKALPADVAIMAAAVADWRTKDYAGEKMKKRGSAPPALILTENPDILANVASGKKRPKLLIGFAAETEKVIDNATAKRKRKGVDWIVANDVSGDVMGGDSNTIHIVRSSGVESLEELPKMEVARELIERVAKALEDEEADG